MAIGKLIIYSAVVDLSTWGECRHIEPVLSPVKSFRPVGMLWWYGQVTTEDETKSSRSCLTGLKWLGIAWSLCKSLYSLKCVHSVETIIILLSVSECMDFIQTWSGMHWFWSFIFSRVNANICACVLNTTLFIYIQSVIRFYHTCRYMYIYNVYIYMYTHAIIDWQLDYFNILIRSCTLYVHVPLIYMYMPIC